MLGAVGPIVEIGAGSGHWQRALSERGVDIVAFDNFSQLPLAASGEPGERAPAPHELKKFLVGEVQQGDESTAAKFPERALLLCYPPAGGFALRCLRQYKGSTLLYVGEGRDGCNASDEFFDALESGKWAVDSVTPLAPFVGGCEQLFVLRRVE